jgi:transcriptional regulator with XRE-family HTH domain
LAEKAGTAPTYIAMIESELRSPSFKMIECIAEALGIEPPELFSTRNYPAESAAELIEDLSDKFDRFLRASIREIRNGSKQE